MTSEDNCGLSALQKCLELCKIYSLSVHFDVLSVQGVNKGALAACSSASGDKASFADLNTSHVVEKRDLERLLAVYEEKLADAERHIKDYYHNKGTLDDLKTEVDEAEAMLKRSDEQAHFPEDIASRQSNQLAGKDAALGSYREPVVVFEKDSVNASAEAERLTTNIRSTRICLTVSVWPSLVTGKLYSSVLRPLLRILRRYWLTSRLWTPNSVVFGNICNPRLIQFRRLWTSALSS